jgi:methionyl-tRNA formyltransferase
MTGPLRLVFFGSDPIALPALDWLAGEGSSFVRVAAVFTQPDRPAGRGQKTLPGPIKAWALARGLPVHQPARLTDESRSEFAALGADAGLVFAYGHILSEAFIATPRLGLLNLHASLLPKYRGASPIQAAIAGGERETGVSLMRIARELDAGPVADAERVGIGPLDTSVELGARLAQACIPVLSRALPRLARDELVFTPQDGAAATFCRRLRKEDGVLDFRAPAAILAARINALFPWPGCSVEVAGQPIKLGRADAKDGVCGEPPGVVLGADAAGVLVATAAGILRLRELQRQGGRMLPAADFLRGFPIPAETVLASEPMGEFVRSP